MAKNGKKNPILDSQESESTNFHLDAIEKFDHARKDNAKIPGALQIPVDGGYCAPPLWAY